jgi:phenylalanyl-tRNA synthetase alpha chain
VIDKRFFFEEKQTMEDKIRALSDRALEELEKADTAEALEAWRLSYLSRKGELNSLMSGLRDAAPEDRPRLGQEINRLKVSLQEGFTARQERFEEERRSRAVSAEQVDVTLPGISPSPGRLHLTTLTLRKICRIFHGMGFEVLESPEVESDEYNFEMLNMPPHHPARDMWDTFYLTESVLLRTHTSPGQIHAMLPAAPKPLRVILPGRCYRYEAVTARSEFMFYQVEGLAVGPHITLSHLKGVLETFARQMFGEERTIRFRGSYFPFTEPSVEVDMDCDRRRRHGAPEGPGKRRLRPEGALGPCLRHGTGADRHAHQPGGRHPLPLQQRPAVPLAVRIGRDKSDESTAEMA